MNSVKNRILLVDDDPTNISILETILEEENYELKSVDSGQKALDVVYDFKPDIVLLDVMMPEMDGYEVCQRMCQDKELKFIKKILVSAKAMLEERLQGYAHGADDYITKPFDDKELLAKVKVFLNLKFVEEIDAFKSQLLCLISHEIRTPLNNILSYSSLLEKSSHLQEEERGYLRNVIDSGNQLLDLSHKALLLSEMKSGMKLAVKSECIEKLINIVVRKLHEKSVEKKIILIFDSQIKEKFLFDLILLEYAILFILESAIKYSSVSNEIIISTSLVDRNCIIEIKGKGLGVEKEQIDKIFKGFSENSLGPDQEEQELSLALIRNIVGLHGGEFSVVNDSNQEISFSFHIPMDYFK